MRAKSIVRQVMGDVGNVIHSARVNAITAAVLALISGGNVGLTALGRAIAEGAHKHGIKRVDRLLGNRALADELDVLYGVIARYSLRSATRPTILLDWTKIGKTMCALTAAVPVEGRAITIYSVTVPLSKYTSVAVEKDFLKQLALLVGPGCKPILVGDAGFRGPWMKRVLALNWDFVTRIRGRTFVRAVGKKDWQHWKKLHPLARRIPRSLGRYCFVRSRTVEAQLVVVDRRSKRARSSKNNRRNLRALRAVQAQREPWFLATSLTWSAKKVVKIYALRMQIELMFRDLKSRRFGWGFEDARCRSTSRVAIQIMLAAFASLVSMLVGIAAETAGLHTRFQANTIRKRRVLSFVYLGCIVLKDPSLLKDLVIPDLADHVQFEGIH
jgi:hypothetical protein